jgi:hypothetical protein
MISYSRYIIENCILETSVMNWYIIILFILGIGLYLYSRYLILQKEYKQEKIKLQQEKIEAFEQEARSSPQENIQRRHNITLVFKNANEANKLAVSSIGEYINGMNQPNLLARGFQSQNELIRAYNNAFEDITDDDATRITKFILELLDKIQYRNPKYYKYIIHWLGKISIAKAKNEGIILEGGMPHTLGNMIIMDSGWFINPRSTTLIHELTHIHQRNVPFEFEDLYPQLGYISYDVRSIYGMEGILLLNRNNPDGLSPNWLWCSTTCWWIGAVFPTATPNNLTDVNLVALKLERDPSGNYYYLKQTPTPLETLKEFNNYFGANANNYHPNEMTAKFGEWFLEDILGSSAGQKYSQYKGYNIYKNYITKLISTYY